MMDPSVSGFMQGRKVCGKRQGGEHLLVFLKWVVSWKIIKIMKKASVHCMPVLCDMADPLSCVSCKGSDMADDEEGVGPPHCVYIDLKR